MKIAIEKPPCMRRAAADATSASRARGGDRRGARPALRHAHAIQKAVDDSPRQTAQRRQLDGMTGSATSAHNQSTLPRQLRRGVEQLSGLPMSDVQVHYNSARPAAIQAHAYTQGTQIHVGPGQERHLPHEAWHVAQQKQGRVKPTMQMQGAAVNDDPALEREADRMGALAARNTAMTDEHEQSGTTQLSGAAPLQRKVGFEFETSWEMAATEHNAGTKKALPIKEALVAEDGWSLHADFNKTPVAEFVTDPVEESDWLELFSQLNAMETYTGNLVSAAGRAGEGGTWVNVLSSAEKDVWIKKGDAEMRAAPQMTAGFRLERIPEIMKAMGGRHKPGSKQLLAKPEGEGAEKLAQLMNKARNKADAFCRQLDQNPEFEPLSGLRVSPPTPEFKGVLSLLGLYALLGQEHAPLDYAKELSPLMARTNLGKLPLAVRTHGKLLEGVLYVAGTRDANGKLFKHGFKQEDRTVMLGPTIKQWLDGIQKGDDPLRQFSGGVMSALTHMEGVGTTQTVKEAGEGYDFQHAAQGMIIEFRGMKEGLPRTRWGALAEQLRVFVADINDTSKAPDVYAPLDDYTNP